MSLILLAVAAIGKAISDASIHGKLSWGDYWNESTAWKYKWKNGDPKQGERFIGSSTIFVFVTSGFHLAQFVYLNALFLFAIYHSVYYSKLASFVIFSIGFRVLFEITYRFISFKKGST